MTDLKAIAAMALSEAKKLGAQTAQCTVTEKETKEFNAESGAFTLMRTLFDSGVAVTVFKDKAQGAVGINSFDEEAVKGAVAQAVAAAESAAPDDAWEIDASGAELYFEDGALECDTEKLFERTKELMEDTKGRHPKLLIEQMITDHTAGHSVYMNSYGTTYERRTGAYEFFFDYSAHEGEKGSHTFGSSITAADLDRRIIECGLIEKELSDTEKQASPEPFGDKFTGTVVFTPGCLTDVVFGTMIGSFISDMPLIDGTSTWKDKLGAPVADARMNVRIAPSDPRIVCGARYSGEGFLSEDFDLIKDGVLQNFFLSQYGANKTGFKRAPSLSHALIAAPGEKSLDEIIAGIDRGIVIGRFSGGRPGANGEFSGVAKNSFLIEDGKITKALSETMISANLNEMLFSLRDVSREVLEDGSMSVPYMAFDGVTISGK